MSRVLCAGAVEALFLSVSLAGCSSQAVKTHPVSGKVEIKDGDVSILTKSSVQLQSESDEFVLPSGNIDASGQFVVKTIYQGKMLPGAPAGKYKARIILADESDEGVPKRKGNPIHPRFLEFRTSGLSITVPSSEYTISLSRK